MFKPKPALIGYGDKTLGHDWSVAIQGQIGSFSHQVVSNVFPHMSDGTNVSCHDDFEGPFNEVAQYKRRNRKLAVVPVENTIAGNVPYVFNLFRHSNLSIIGEYFLGVQFHLLIRPEANILDVKEVHSHVHALAQCSEYIDRHPQWRSVVNPDTAGAAKMVSEQDDPSIAAIASRFAAQVYGLKVADQHIQDRRDPITRFMVFHQDEMIPNINSIGDDLPRHRFVSNIYIKPKRSIERPVTEILRVFSQVMPDRAEPVLEKYKGNNLRHEGYLAEVMGHRDEKVMGQLIERLNSICSHVEEFGCYYAHHYHRFPHRAGKQLGSGKYQFD